MLYFGERLEVKLWVLQKVKSRTDPRFGHSKSCSPSFGILLVL